MKAKHISLSAALALAIAFSGCTHPVVNVTLPQAAENPSRIYTLMVNARVNNPKMVEGSLHAFVTIDGAEHEMTPLSVGDQLFEYDYTMPADHALAKYYYTIRYDEKNNDIITHRSLNNEDGIYTLKVVSRYVREMEVERGPVGSVVPVVGNGFANGDFIVIGGTPMPAHVASANAMTFTVPPLPAGDYPVEWHSGTDVTQIGGFHVDSSALTVTPASLELASGDATALTISMAQPAPDGGVPFAVLTDVPGSVVMPAQIVISAGATSATVKVAGGAPGMGSLHISAPGIERAIVSIKVNPAPVLPQVAPPPAEVTPVAPTPTAPVVTPETLPPANPAPKDLPAAAVIGS